MKSKTDSMKVTSHLYRGTFNVLIADNVISLSKEFNEDLFENEFEYSGNSVEDFIEETCDIHNIAYTKKRTASTVESVIMKVTPNESEEIKTNESRVVVQYSIDANAWNNALESKYDTYGLE